MDTPICNICSDKPTKYNCPRCNIPYCSVQCYNSPAHTQCSELFYKDNVMEEMAMLGKKPNPAVDDENGDEIKSVKKMYEILKRMENAQALDDDDPDLGGEEDQEQLDSDDEDDEIDLAERLENVDLDDANELWKHLTDAERQEFENLVRSEDICKVMEFKEPWWTYTISKPLIVELATAEAKDHSEQSNPLMPKISQKISSLSSLLTKPPSPCLRHNIVNILAAYTIANRFFNGELLSNVHECCSFLISICANLRYNANFEDDQLAVDAVIHDCGTAHVVLEVGQDVLIGEDVDAIVCGPHGSNEYVLAALSDIQRIIESARKKQPNTPTATQSEFSKRFMDHQHVDPELINRTKLLGCLKKIEFCLAFVNSNSWATS